ncbi:MAG: hypothetical protein A2X94_03755 [Bdellovibrionales bacterium GWB1_55_8]|nr:MAG: hypothetical protein A2X94_03755 [Bdellovibrionales bacterium GWB1_55_8]
MARTTKKAVGDGSYLRGLNDRQREAVLATEGPLIVLAGAGSGKTKMLTSRICHLIEAQGVPAHRILAMTFTNKAAGEMRERVARMLAESARQGGGGYLGNPELGTFHSVCVRLLRRELGRTPFTKPFVIYDDSDQLSLIKRVQERLSIDDKAFSPKGIQAAINRAKCDAISPEEMESAPHDIFGRQVKRVYDQYQKDLVVNNALDFGEIICMTYRLLRDCEDVRETYQDRFRYIHVDEYQDTNRAQYLLLSMLAKKQFGGHENICVVGDEDQSIYKWRGADIRNILDFESDYPGAQVVKLEQNYRSTKTIIAAAGHVIKNNLTRKDKTLWTENEDGLPIVHAQLPDERAEAELVVSEIKRQGSHEGRGYGDFAIFYRTNAQSRQFEDVLRREKIPYQVVGGLRFYDRKEIKDILSYLKVILNPTDSVNLRRIINVPARAIGKTTIEKLDEVMMASQGPITFWEILERAALDPSMTSAGTARKIGAFVQLIRKITEEQPKLLLSELYHLILDETGYVRELRKEGTEEAEARIENLEELDTIFQEFEEDQFNQLSEEERKAQPEERKRALLPAFIEQSSLVSDLDSMEGQASSVKMMTLHSSKGLEFPVVFLVGMEEGLFPSVRAWEEASEEDIEEERRLCYVGMTRARERLFLSNVVVRRIWGNVNYQEPSRFFVEIPGRFLEMRDFAPQVFGGASASTQRSFSSIPAPKTGGWSPARPATPAATGAGNDVIGRRIHHPEYGEGSIVLAEGSADDRKVTVEFAGKQRRKFLFRYVASYLS